MYKEVFIVTLTFKRAMSKRGVSAEEKRARMLQLLYEKKEFFQLKDLEKIAPKEKGIIANSVKDVIQGLVDEGLVDTDKIGTSVYYWAFPSKGLNTRKRKFNELSEQYETAKKKLKLAEENLKDSKVDKEDGEERNTLLDKLMDLQIERDELLKQLQTYKDNDPRLVEKMKAEIQGLKDAANRWTDNIFSISAWCRNKFNIEQSILDKQFGIPADLDYIE